MTLTSSNEDWHLGESATGIRVHFGYGIFLLLLIVVFGVRIANAAGTTIFYDEAINIINGWETVSSEISLDATSWVSGSYLYPILAGTVHNFTGDFGIRFLTAVLNTFAVALIFFLTLDLFDHRSALWAMLIFGLNGANISLGQLAIHESLSLPLMTIAFYCVIQAGLPKSKRTNLYLIGAGITLAFSILVKYVGLFFLPALFWIAIVHFVWHGKSVKPVLLLFFPTAVFIIGAYFLWNQETLTTLWEQQQLILFSSGEKWTIFRSYLQNTGVSLILALIGVLLLPSFQNPNKPPVTLNLKGAFFLFILLASLVGIYQIFSENMESLWKHAAYSTIFFAPFAGFGVSRLMAKGRHIFGKRNGNIPYRLLFAFLSIVAVIFFIERGMAQNWGLLHSWPNLNGANAYLETQPLSLETRILAEESAVYKYYNDLGTHDQEVWSNTFNMEYGGFEGTEAMTTAIQDQYFDLVILDDYFTQETNALIREALLQNNYKQVYEDPEPQLLSTGQTVTVMIYEAP